MDLSSAMRVPGLRRVERTFEPAGEKRSIEGLYEGWKLEVRRAGGGKT